MLEKIDHIGIVVKNIDESLKLYKKAFGLDPIKTEFIEETKLKIAFVKVGEVLVEFVEPMEAGFGMVGRFLVEKGEGIHHIAYRVADIKAAMEKMKKAEIPLTDEEPQYGADDSSIAFLEASYTQNVVTELVQRKREIK
jgi:methylmalonyl-CoA/ethylmalonyl-CoA epimerase